MRKLLAAYAKTKPLISCALTAQLISAFVFTTKIVKSLYFLNLIFQGSSHILWRYSPLCVRAGLVGNPKDRFCRDSAHMIIIIGTDEVCF